VKVRGHRIELGEVEGVLSEVEWVREAVVVVREDEEGEPRLVAYVVVDGGGAGAGRELRPYLKQRLAEYMMPWAIVELAEMPLTAHGKVDRRALPAPSAERPALEKAYLAPRNQTEEILAGIWSQMLGVEQVGIDDNFFELGGHSLLATQVVARAREAFKVELPLRMMFEQPTIAGLAEAVRGAGAGMPAIVAVSRETRRVTRMKPDRSEIPVETSETSE
jgi:acyl carrier protein